MFRDLPPEQQSRLEAAARWWPSLVRDPSLERSAEYLAWCADPRNVSALKAVREAWAQAGSLGDTPALVALRHQALDRLRLRAASRLRFQRLAAAVAAAALLVIGAITLLTAGVLHPHPHATEYQTGIGERRTLGLPDGSRVEMDSDTQVHVAFSDKARLVTLDRGRSRFDVAHDPGRPFSVTAGPETVVAVGTSFNVERLPSAVVVTLIEGRVLVRTHASAGEAAASAPAVAPVALTAGQQLVAPLHVEPAVLSADLPAAMAWETGHLVFRDEPLGSVVARVNRYALHPVTIDPSLASLRISGVFNAGDVDSFVSAVTSYLHVQASTTDERGILLEPGRP